MRSHYANCDEKIEIIEVSVVETSENIDVEVDEKENEDGNNNNCKRKVGTFEVLGRQVKTLKVK
jgi:hypothetical protein